MDADQLARLGFQNPRRAERELATLRTELGDAAADAILALARASPDPDAQVAAFERCAGALRPVAQHRPRLEALSKLFLASDLWPRMFAARPALVRWICGARTLAREKPRATYVAEVLARVARVKTGSMTGSVEDLQRALRRHKYRELLRISWRDVVLGAPMPELGRELAALAEACVRGALAWAERTVFERFGSMEPSGFAVLGMGKLGGEDLNFSSDIDLIFLFRGDGHTGGGTDGKLENAKAAVRLGELVTRALSAVTSDGFCYRTDLNLRPQGRSGALALSLAATTGYYESFGRTWERSALIKARCVAGDADLASELLDGLTPFVWRRSLDLGAVDALREMKGQIDLRGKASADDVKLGPGGIREIEFFTHALQLLHGGRDDTLRERNTVKAVRKLANAGHLSLADADRLQEAYVFLRRVENRLQMREERQTQELPPAGERLRLARSLGFADEGTFAAELDRHRGFVLRAFRTLLGETARDEIPDEPLLALALDPDAPEQARREALAGRGFVEPERAIAALERLSRVPGSPFTSQPGPSAVRALKLLAEVARTPDPDQALHHLADFLSHLRAPQGYLELLTTRSQVSRRLLNLFGQSDFLSRYFLGHPQLFDALVQGEAEDAVKPAERIRQELSQRVHRHDDPEERLATLRRVKNEEVLRIGVQDISGELTVPQVAEQLTAIADGVLDECLFLAMSEALERHGDPVGARGLEHLAVIAMGKLGGRELGYHSDLDLIFVYSGEGQEETTGGSRGKISHHELFAKVAQRLITFLQLQLGEGYLYKIDTRLRPSGNKGALVVSERAFHEHHHKRAQLWERQALIKARGAAGELSLFDRLRRQTVDPLVYERPLPDSAAQEIDRLRTRMEKEIDPETAEQLNLKTGHGGLVDVEFAVQYLQLRHGAAHPSVRTSNTLDAVEALVRAGVLSEEDALTLREGYLFHRRVENRLRLVHGRSLSNFPTHGRALAQLARRLGYLGTDAELEFLHAYRAYTERVRDVYARVFRQGH